MTDTSALITRTHRVFGTFPSALLLLGYGETEIISQRDFTTQIPIGEGRMIDVSLELSTQSKLGLPRGSDPLVLGGLLALLFKRKSRSNTLVFRKTELLEVLGWANTTATRAEIEQAIIRYQNANYQSRNAWAFSTGSGGHKGTTVEARHLISGYKFVDDRRTRYIDESLRESSEFVNQFSQVTFNELFINDIRLSGVSINFGLLRSIRSPITRRLLEIFNLMAEQDERRFSFEIKELAHQKLGISPGKSAPSQLWQTIHPAFRNLKTLGVLNSFRYDKKHHRVTGEISAQFKVAQLPPLPPLELTTPDRKTLRDRLEAVGVFPKVARTLLNECVDSLLPDFEKIVGYVEHDRAANASRQTPKPTGYNYGGWLVTEIRHLISEGRPRLDFTVREPQALKAAPSGAALSGGLPFGETDEVGVTSAVVGYGPDHRTWPREVLEAERRRRLSALGVSELRAIRLAAEKEASERHSRRNKKIFEKAVEAAMADIVMREE